MKPAVSRLEEIYKDRVEFELINIDLPESADAKQKYRFIGQPQFVIVKPDGEVLVSRNGYQQFERLRDDLNQALGVDE
jgi:biopolymer transport protein ExbD